MNQKKTNNEPTPSGRFGWSTSTPSIQNEYRSEMLKRLTEIEEIIGDKKKILAESNAEALGIAKQILSEQLNEYSEHHSKIISSAKNDLDEVAKKSAKHLEAAYIKENSNILEVLSGIEELPKQYQQKNAQIFTALSAATSVVSVMILIILNVVNEVSLLRKSLDRYMPILLPFMFIVIAIGLIYLFIKTYRGIKKFYKNRMEQYKDVTSDLIGIRIKSRLDYMVDLRIAVDETINLHFSNIVSEDEILLVDMESSQLVESKENDIVRSESIEDVCQFIEQHKTSSLGISGSRGIGKSTILRQIANEFNGPENCVISMSIPVHYEPEAMVQRLLIDFITQAKRWKKSFRPDVRRNPEPSIRDAIVKFIPIILVMYGIAIISFVSSKVREFFIYPNGESLVLLDNLVPIISVICMLLVFVLYIFQDVYRSKIVDSSLFPKRTKSISLDDENEMYSLEKVEERLHWHTEKHTSNDYSATTPSIPLSIKKSSQIRLSENPKGIHNFTIEFQQVVSYFQKSESVKRIIFCIDELDKISNARGGLDIVNELKDLMHIEGVHFVLTVSNDALKSFALRGIPVRDAIDSAFDEVFEIKEISVKEAHAIIVKRAPAFPPPLTRFCYAWSLGNPRELLRCARKCVKVSKNNQSTNAAGVQSQNTSSTNARTGLGAIVSHVVLEDLDSIVMTSLDMLFECGLDRCVISEFRRAYDQQNLSKLADILRNNMNSAENGFHNEISALIEYILFAERTILEFGASRAYSEWVNDMKNGRLDAVAEKISQERINTRRWLGIHA